MKSELVLVRILKQSRKTFCCYENFCSGLSSKVLLAQFSEGFPMQRELTETWTRPIESFFQAMAIELTLVYVEKNQLLFRKYFGKIQS